MLDIEYNIYVIDGYLTTKQASSRCGLSQAHIRHLLETGTIEGVKAGHDWLLRVSSLNQYLQNRPKPGRRPTRRGDVQNT